MANSTGRKQRPLAVVTGASGGLGEAFARRLAVTHDLVLVARSEARLSAVRDALLTDVPGGAFRVLVADLSTPAGVEQVLGAVGGQPVDLLVNNAGSGHHGRFVEEPAERVAAEVALDCGAVAALTRGLLPGMVARGRGAVVNVASTAAFQPVPTMAVYAAAKAFVLSLSEALHVETRGTGVTVLAVCPGGIDTGFFDAAGAEFLTRHRLTVSQVVEATLRALATGKPVEVPGLRNKLTALGYRFVPRRVLARSSGWIVRARSAP